MATINQLDSILSGETGTGSYVGSASATLTGVPLAPTATPLTSNTQLATTAYADAAVAAAGTGLTWSGIAGTTQSAAINNGYTVDNAAQTTITLPATFVKGDIVQVLGDGAGGWIVEAGVGTVVKIGSTATSSGGTLTSAGAGDTIKVVGLVDDTSWRVMSVISAGLTVA